jgi:Taurine catabolism dioxygenase TauD, TfdA family
MGFSSLTVTILVFLSISFTISSTSAFIPSTGQISRIQQRLNAVSVEEETSIERTAPYAGKVPEWENRQGLSPEVFIKSDMSKPDVSDMWECPLTRWDSDNINIVQAQQAARKMPNCPLQIRASVADNKLGAQYFVKNQQKIKSELLKYGAIWFRGFTLMQSVQGNREMWEALEINPCLDPLHSSGLRKFASERDALYEEVNKPSLRGHYIGLHCESTSKRTAAYAAFVCFQKATQGGGRFLVADGAAILAELDTKTLQKLYNRKIRISVSNLDIPPALPGFAKNIIKDVVDMAVAPKFDMDLEMIYESDGKPGRLQVRFYIGWLKW